MSANSTGESPPHRNCSQLLLLPLLRALVVVLLLRALIVLDAVAVAVAVAEILAMRVPGGSATAEGVAGALPSPPVAATATPTRTFFCLALTERYV
jgi:hypothetical protein